jgi:hypothetical protein
MTLNVVVVRVSHGNTISGIPPARLPVHQGSLSQLREVKHKALADFLHISAYSYSRPHWYVSLQMRLTSAVNALPGVSKIRYVAASLLDELDTHASHTLEI